MIVRVAMCMVHVWKPQVVDGVLMVSRDLKGQLGVPVHREKMLEDPRCYTLAATFSSAGCTGGICP